MSLRLLLCQVGVAGGNLNITRYVVQTAVLYEVFFFNSNSELRVRFILIGERFFHNFQSLEINRKFGGLKNRAKQMSKNWGEKAVR